MCTCGHSTRCTADLLSQVNLPGRHQLEGLMRLKFGHVPPLQNWPRNIRGPPCGYWGTLRPRIFRDVEQREKTTHPGTGQREQGQGGMMQATCSLPTFVINSPLVTTPNQSSAPYLILPLKPQRIRSSSNKTEWNMFWDTSRRSAWRQPPRNLNPRPQTWNRTARARPRRGRKPGRVP